MMRKTLHAVLAIALTTSCTGKNGGSSYSDEEIAALKTDSAEEMPVSPEEPEFIDLTKCIGVDKEWDLCEVLDSVKLIFLSDSTPESLTGYIENVLIGDDNIYITDNVQHGSIVIFDKKGNFVKRIPHGNGPGETYDIYETSYDGHKKQLIVNQPDGLSFFSSDGRFLNKRYVPFAFQDFLPTDTGYMFYQRASFTNQHLKRHEKKSLLITNKEFRLLSSALPMSTNIPVGKIGSNLMKYKDEVIVTKSLCDTIYSYRKGKTSAKYRIHLGDETIESSALSGKETHSMQSAEKEILRNQKLRFTGEFFETSTHLFFRIYQGDRRYIMYYDKDTKNIIGGYTVYWNANDITNVSNPYYIYDDWFIVPVVGWKAGRTFSDRFISAEDNAKIAKLNEESNPVLFLFKLKRF